MSRLFIDITEVVRTTFTTGIQRVVKEFTRRLISHREKVVLLRHIATKNYYEIIPTKEFENWYAGIPIPAAVDRQTITLDDLTSNDLFLDLDSVWNKLEQRRQFVYERLHNRGVTILTLVYDILPIMYPQFFHEDTLWHFIIYLSAVLTYTDIIIVNSEATKHEIEKLPIYAKFPPKEILVVPLGADFKDNVYEMDEIGTETIQAAEYPYLMMLGTLEPRKNHALLLDAFDEGLYALPINIVIAGRKGWNVDDLMERINSHPQLGKRVFFLECPSDQEVAYLYQHAYGLVFASFGEGFGLPLIEAMYYQKLAFASDIEVFHEVGQDRCVFFNPHDPQSLIQRVSDMLSDRKMEEEYLRRVKDYHVTSWNEAVVSMMDAINEGEKYMVERACPEVSKIPSQMYMISARKEDILETLPYYEHFMPFITNVVIGCPEMMAQDLKDSYQGRFNLTFLTDEYLLKERKLPRDHQERNLLLRSLAIQDEAIDDVFIMADDDNRPLRTIPVDYFIDQHQFKLYYCNEDVREWQPYIGGATSYDAGIKRTAAFLDRNGLSFKQYSSHEPQVICKRVFVEALEKYPEVLGDAIDEWSFYGNYALTFYRDYFSSLPYTTMCWPAMSSDWKVTVPPREYWFENFYRVLYRDDGIFKGFSTGYHAGTLEENITKIQLRLEEQHQYDSGIAVSKACDDIYYETYHAQPEWELDLDHLIVRAPKVLMGKSGYMKKMPIHIRNILEHRSLRIEGIFKEQGTELISGFQNEDLDIRKMNGTYELNVHFPKWKFNGFLHISFILDEKYTVRAKIPVITY